MTSINIDSFESRHKYFLSLNSIQITKRSRFSFDAIIETLKTNGAAFI